MSLKVIGAGVGRTGTHSLKLALETLLDGPCHHMVEVFAHADEQVPVWTAAVSGEPVDWHSLLGGYVALVDWPGASFWPELSEAFPDALVLLSLRDPEEWYRSATDTIFHGMSAAASNDAWMATMLQLLGERFCADLGDRDAMIEAFEHHNDRVRAAVPPSRLLEWTPSAGWEPICQRLGVPVPDEPFPLTNTTEEFRSRFVDPQPAGD